MKREATKTRLNNILCGDREDMNEATRAAALNDFTKVAKEYFDTGEINFDMKRGKSGTDVTLSFRATRIKNFTALK